MPPAASPVRVQVCIDFWAPWCGPCRMMSPVFDEFSDKYAGRCSFVKIDVDKSEVRPPPRRAAAAMFSSVHLRCRAAELCDGGALRGYAPHGCG
jgi:thiol-disulfide isomerase/thioredoxin